MLPSERLLLKVLNNFGIIYTFSIIIGLTSSMYFMFIPKLYFGINLMLMNLWIVYILINLFGNYYLLFKRYKYSSTEIQGYLLDRRCEPCDMLVPSDVHHCVVCKTCILKRDHHCFFTGVCIGLSNQYYFSAFLLHCTLGCLLTIYLCIEYMANQELKCDSKFGNWVIILPITFYEAIRGNCNVQYPFLILIGWVAFISMVAAANFLFWQSFYIWKNSNWYDWKMKNMEEKRAQKGNFSLRFLFNLLFPIEIGELFCLTRKNKL